MADAEATSRVRGRFVNTAALVAAFAVLALAALPRDAAALTAMLVAAVSPAIIVALDDRETSPMGRRDMLVVTVVAVPVVLLLTRSLVAHNPWVSFSGIVGQHSGSALWVLAYLVFVCAYITARPRNLGHALRAVSVLGVPLAVAAILEAVGIIPGSAYSAPPSGILENPSSLGQTLVIATLCAAGWALAVPRERPLAAVTALLGIAGLVVAASEGAWAGLVAGAILGGGVWLLAKRSRLRAYVVVAATVIVLVAVTAFTAYAGSSYAAGGQDVVTQLTHDRAAIWASALAQIDQAPLIGSGAEQFSAWVTWESEPGISLEHVGTYDPHSIVLWWALAVGLPGAMIALGAALLLVWRLADGVKARPSPAGAAVLAVLGGFGVTIMLTWTAPLALTAAALLAGTALGAMRERTSSGGGGPRAALWAAAALGVLVGAIVLSGGAVTEYRWASAVRSGDLSVQERVEFARATGEPSYWASAAASRRGSSLDAEIPVELDASLREDAEWHVDAAFEHLALQMAFAGGGETPDLDSFEAAVDDGRTADPASGLWDYTAVVFLRNTGEDDLAAEHAARALTYPLSDEVRAYVERFAR